MESEESEGSVLKLSHCYVFKCLDDQLDVLALSF